MKSQRASQARGQPDVVGNEQLPDVKAVVYMPPKARTYGESLVHFTAFSLAHLLKFCEDVRAANPASDVLFIGNGGNGKPQADVLENDLNALGFKVDTNARVRSKAYDIALVQSRPVPLEAGKAMLEYVLEKNPIVIIADNSRGRVASAMYGYKEVFDALNILNGKGPLEDPANRSKINQSTLGRYSIGDSHPLFKGYKRFLFWDPLDMLDGGRPGVRVSGGREIRQGDIVAANLQPPLAHTSALDKPRHQAFSGLAGNLSHKDIMPIELDSRHGSEVMEQLGTADGRRLIDFYRGLL
jgi:hypothetical protein